MDLASQVDIPRVSQQHMPARETHCTSEQLRWQGHAEITPQIPVVRP